MEVHVIQLDLWDGQLEVAARGLTSIYGLDVDQLLHDDLVNAKREHVSANYTNITHLSFALRGG